MTPSYTVASKVQLNRSKGIVVVSHLPYTIPDVATKVVRLDVWPGTKVSDFIDLIVDRKRHQYEVNSEGQRCRFWTDDQISLLSDAADYLANESQIDEARRAIRTQYPDGYQCPLVVGSYYPS